MSNYVLLNGAGYFTASTLGNLLTANKLRVVIKNLKIVSDGFLLSQSVAGGSREFGLLYAGTTLNYVFGSADEKLILTNAEVVTYFSSPATLDLTFNSVNNSVIVNVNGVLLKTLTLSKSTNRVDGCLLRIGARGAVDNPSDTGGGFLSGSGNFIGDTDIYVNDSLVRRYIIPLTGNVIPESVSSSVLTQRGSWPADNSEYINVPDPQNFTVNESEVYYGGVISGSYTSWPTIPNGIMTLKDSANNLITVSLNIVGGVGNGSWYGVIPQLPNSGEQIKLLRLGATSISFSGSNSITGPMLVAKSDKSIAVLKATYDSYLFQEWDSAPKVGDYLISNTLEVVFNNNGDCEFYNKGIFPMWYMDSGGMAYGLLIDTTGLSTSAIESVFTAVLKPTMKPLLNSVLRNLI